MPLRRSHWTRGISAAAIALAVVPSLASAKCVEASTTKAFAQYGDDADYSVAPDGTFEAGAKGWTLAHGAKVVAGNTSVPVSGVKGSKSLVLPMGATATSPEFCVGREHPYFRFMLRANAVASGLQTVIQYKDVNGNVTGYGLSAWLAAPSWMQPTLIPGDWTPGDKNPLSLTIPLSEEGTATARIVFIATSGSYNVDDVMIDPYRRG